MSRKRGFEDLVVVVLSGTGIDMQFVEAVLEDVRVEQGFFVEGISDDGLADGEATLAFDQVESAFLLIGEF